MAVSGKALWRSAPSTAILLSAAIWGTFWIPLRQLDAVGLNAAWATTGSFFLPLLLLLPFGLLRLRRLLAGGWTLVAMGLFLSLATSLYAEGLLRGHVARVVLLFYLTPVWSCLLARLMLGDPITGRRIATILLGLSGMLVVFGVDAGLPLPRSLADGMGLLAGFLWGLGLVYLRRCEARPLFDLTFAQLPFLAICFFTLSFIPGGRGFGLPGLAIFQDAVPWLLLFAFVWVLPVVWLTAYGGSKLEPGRVGILLLFDIVIGLTTAALLTDEPFGAREVIGGLLIMAATAVELLGGMRRRSAAMGPPL